MHKRRIVVVAGFQSQWILTLLVWVAVLLVGFLILVLGPLAWQVSTGSASHADYETASALLMLNDRLWLPLVGLFLSLTFVIVKLTHRVAGPLYRFRVVFEEMAKGNLAVRAGIRERDYLHLESTALQDALDALSHRIGRAQASIAKVQEELAAYTSDQMIHGSTGLDSARAAAARAQVVLAEFVVDRPDGRAEPRRAAAVSTAPIADEGFSLIELLIVSSLTITLASLAMPAYEGALYRARVTRAIGDINAIGKEVVMFQVTRNCFPVSLVDIQRDSLKDPWGRKYVYLIAQAPGGGSGGSCQACGNVCEPHGKAKKDKNLKPVNADFDLYSVGKDGETATNLSNKKSDDDVLRGRSGSFIGLASEF